MKRPKTDSKPPKIGKTLKQLLHHLKINLKNTPPSLTTRKPNQKKKEHTLKQQKKRNHTALLTQKVSISAPDFNQHENA
jgi:hypothetical protein